VIAEQRGIDVSIRVSGPDGKTIADFDAESRPRGQERVEMVSDEAATYQVTVSARYPYDPAGAYALRVDDIHRSTDRDLRLDEARRLYTAMEPLRAAGKYADAAAGFTRQKTSSRPSSVFARRFGIRRRILGRRREHSIEW